MKKSSLLTSVLILFILGCAHIKTASIQYPVYQYGAPTDFVYLKVLDSLNAEEGWVLHHTDKSNGIIEIKNIAQMAAQESDTQHARFIVTRIDRDHTSVELDDKASRCRDDTCLKILLRINDRIKQMPSREIDQTIQAAE